MVSTVLYHSLIFSLLFCVVILLSWYFSPKVWISDLTEGKVKGPMGLEYIVWVSLIMLLFFLGPAVSGALLIKSYGANFWQCFAGAYVFHIVVNIVDVLIIDIFIYMWLKPSWMQIEGFEPLYSYWAHIRASLKGLLLGIPMAAASAGLAFLF